MVNMSEAPSGAVMDLQTKSPQPPTDLEKATDMIKVRTEKPPLHPIGGATDFRALWEEKDWSGEAEILSKEDEGEDLGATAHRLDDGRAFFKQTEGLHFIGEENKRKILSILEGAPEWMLSKITKRGFKPVVFSNLLEKGGGVHPHFPEILHEDKLSGKSDINKFRYYKRELYRPQEPHGSAVGADAYGWDDDAYNSFYFHSVLEGRTRLPVCAFQVTKFNTPDGDLTLTEAVNKGYFPKDASPSLQLWGIRSADRIRGMFRSFDTPGKKYEGAPYYSAGTPHMEYVKTNEATNRITDVWRWYAKRIIGNCRNDELPEWKGLYEKYGDKDLTELTELREFYKEYTPLLAKTIGKQFGLLYANDIVVEQCNEQNFTTLGELVDLDIFLFNGKTDLWGHEFVVDKNNEDRATELMEDGKTRRLLSADERIIRNVEYSFNVTYSLATRMIFEGMFDNVSDRQKFLDSVVQGYADGFIDTGMAREGKYDLTKIKRNRNFLKEWSGWQEGSSWGSWKDYPNPFIHAAKKAMGIVYGFGLKEKLTDY